MASDTIGGSINMLLGAADQQAAKIIRLVHRAIIAVQFIHDLFRAPVQDRRAPKRQSEFFIASRRIFSQSLFFGNDIFQCIAFFIGLAFCRQSVRLFPVLATCTVQAA